MNYVGIDIGGTGIKAGLISDKGEVIKKSSVPTGKTRSSSMVIADIGKQINDLTKGYEYEAVGVGCPGAIDSVGGVVTYANNLFWTDVQFTKELSKYIKKPIKISNDANVAALGEATFGAGKDYKDSVFFTLGTGVGGGIIIDGKIYEGYDTMGAEIGHMVICANGYPCSCGRKGCLEAYASATALTRDTIFAMQTDFNSSMWAFCGNDLNKVDGRTSFECAKKGDATAKKVVDNYISYLSEGIINIINIFRSQAIILGGGVCAQGEYLTVPLQKLIDKARYGGVAEENSKTIIKIASLGNDAGILGAASLVM